MPALEQYGYRSINVGSSRALVVVLVQGAGLPALAHDKSYYQELFFGSNLSVAHYFSAISNGRFTFTKAGDGLYGPIKLSAEEIALALPERFALIKTRLVEAGFNIDNWDLNNDAAVDDSELTMLAIDSSSMDLAARRGTAPSSLIFNGHRAGWNGSACAAGHQASFMTFCHELLHMLGVGAEMYGSNDLNAQYTTMCATIFNTADDRRTWHLDPFHKMKLGWCEPRLYDANNAGSVVVKVHRWDNADAPILLYDGRDESSKRFFIVEYRTAKTEHDEDVGSNGIGIWRVELNDSLSPFEIPSSDPSNTHTDWSVNLQGPPSWSRGHGPLWRAGKTPFFEWTPKCALDIHPFDDSQGQVQVDVTLPQ